MSKILKSLILPLTLVVLITTVVISKGSDDQKPIKFNHGLHVVEFEISCLDCHDGVSNLSAGGRAIPDHDICASCHDTDDDNECSACHMNPDNPVGMASAGEMYAGFAHKAHGSLECSACHSQLTSSEMQPTLPAMADCQSCHLDQNGPLSCAECHQGKSPLPLDHQLTTWNQDHGMEAGAGLVDCASCHSQSSCDECHQGVNLFGSPHPVTWKFNHFAESSFGNECMSCHETRESCTSCHMAMITLPHALGPMWANTTDGGAHKEEAESFIETCLSCHDIGESDPTCAKCHE